MLLRHFLQLHGYSRRKILWFIQQGTLFVDEQRVDSLKKELSFGQTVRVEQGETLFEISLRTGVPVAAIASANGITNYDVIYLNQELLIP
jgi:LysM repeat protein